MRIVVWNCGTRLRGEKLKALESLQPDIAVVAACESPEKLWGKQPLLAPIPMEWIGDNETKGLAVLAFNGFRLGRHTDYDPNLRWLLPVEVRGPIDFHLLAVWAPQPQTSRGTDGSSSSLPIKYYHSFIKAGPTVVAGDFAAAATAGHARTIAGLERLGLASAYHVGRGELHGKESRPTRFGQDQKSGQAGQHVDYCFLPSDWCSGLREVEVGAYKMWGGKGMSDHVPLVVDVDVPLAADVTRRSLKTAKPAKKRRSDV